MSQKHKTLYVLNWFHGNNFIPLRQKTQWQDSGMNGEVDLATEGLKQIK